MYGISDMAKTDLPISIHRLALLQAYLYEVFSNETKCEENFKYTEWFLNENFSKTETNNLLQFLSEKEVVCDCDILKKIDLRELSPNQFEFHKQNNS